MSAGAFSGGNGNYSFDNVRVGKWATRSGTEVMHSTTTSTTTRASITTATVTATATRTQVATSEYCVLLHELYCVM